MSNTPILTDDEAKFCLLFVNASAPLCGNVRECYKKVFNETDDAKALSEGKKLMKDWNLPEGLMGVGALALGYASSHPHTVKPRKEDYYRIIK